MVRNPCMCDEPQSLFYACVVIPVRVPVKTLSFVRDNWMHYFLNSEEGVSIIYLYREQPFIYMSYNHFCILKYFSQRLKKIIIIVMLKLVPIFFPKYSICASIKNK